MVAGQCPKSVRKCPWSAKVVKSRVHANNMGDVGENGEKREVSEKCPKSVRRCPRSAKVVKSRVHANNMGDVGENGEKREVSEKCPKVSEVGRGGRRGPGIEFGARPIEIGRPGGDPRHLRASVICSKKCFLAAGGGHLAAGGRARE
jgi:hypothetical protein